MAEQKAPVKGRFVADLGWYNPHTDEFVVKAEAVTKWLSNGAQPTATVHNLLVTHGLLQADKVTSWRPKKKPAKDDEASAQQKTASTADAGAKASAEQKEKSSASKDSAKETPAT